MIDDGYFELMDDETINQDFDDIDLYGERLIEDSEDSDIQFEQVLTQYIKKQNVDDVLTYTVSFVIYTQLLSSNGQDTRFSFL